MEAMAQVAVAGDVAEAEQLQELLRNAGIDATVAAEGDDEPLTVLVPAGDLEAAQDAIEALSDPDELISEP